MDKEHYPTGRTGTTQTGILKIEHYRRGISQFVRATVKPRSSRRAIMQSDAKGHLIGMAIGIPCVVAGVVFRPFWLSIGVSALIGTFWLIMAIVAGWGGRGKPYSLRFGITFSSGLTLPIAVSTLVNFYLGIALLLLLTYLAFKTGFLEKRALELEGPRSE
jgi:hypothetical protein